MMVVVNSKNVTEIAVCVDCLLVISGADEVTDGNGNDIRAAVVHDIELMWGVGTLQRMVLSTEDDDRWFSKSGCEGCGSLVHGDRMKAVVLPA